MDAKTIKKFCPSAKPEIVAAIVSNWQVAVDAKIDANENRLCMFMASIAVESNGLRATVENMNYTTAAQIRKTWPSRFKSLAAAQPYVRQPEKLANLVYGKRLGNNQPGDGWKYRGGSLMQTTGRANYKKMGFENNPEKLREPVTAFLVAVREWVNRKCKIGRAHV